MAYWLQCLVPKREFVVSSLFWIPKRVGLFAIQATLLNPDMCNPDFRLNRTDWKVLIPSHTYNSYTHNPDLPTPNRDLGSTSVQIKESCLY